MTRFDCVWEQTAYRGGSPPIPMQQVCAYSYDYVYLLSVDLSIYEIKQVRGRVFV